MGTQTTTTRTRLAPDIAELRDTVTSIREALSHSSRPRSYGAPAIPRAGLEETAARLKAMLQVIRSSDLHRLRSTGYRPDERKLELRLGNVFNRLRDLLLRDLLRQLGEGGLGALVALLEDPAPDFMSILGNADSENAHSQVIRWLLDPREASTVGPALLRAISGQLPEPEKWAERVERSVIRGHLAVRREVLMGKETVDPAAADRIDILVSGADFCLAIENKVWSVEHSDQTNTYWHWLEQLPPGHLRGGIFLTPGGASAACRSFKSVSYAQLLGMLVQASRAGTLMPTERAVLAGYSKALADGILGTRIRALRGR